MSNDDSALRERIGQALSDEIAAGAENPDWCDAREIDRLVDAVLKVLPSGTGPKVPPWICSWPECGCASHRCRDSLPEHAR